MKKFNVLFLISALLCGSIFLAGCTSQNISPSSGIEKTTLNPTLQVTSIAATIQTPNQIAIQTTSPQNNSASDLNMTVIPTKDPFIPHEGVSQRASCLSIVGDVIGVKNPNRDNIGYVKLSLELTNGCTPITIAGDNAIQVIFVNNTNLKSNTDNRETYVEKTTLDSEIMNMPKWGILQKVNADSNNRLDEREQIVIGVGIPEKTLPGKHFMIQLLPYVGSATSINCSVPSSLTNINKLECQAN